jgi:PP-loop superfamily ATP-utilizing enzyme
MSSRPANHVAATRDPTDDSREPNEAAYDRLKELLLRMGSVVVAFSGGVDSSLVLAAARELIRSEPLLVGQPKIIP